MMTTMLRLRSIRPSQIINAAINAPQRIHRKRNGSHFQTKKGEEISRRQDDDTLPPPRFFSYPFYFLFTG